MIDVFEGHFCRKLPEKDAATFDLKSEEDEDMFYAVLDVMLHAAKSPQAAQKKIKRETIKENVAITVPRVSKKVEFFFFF